MNVKIIKKHLKDGRNIDDDVFILQYKAKTLFGKEKWKEFPIMFIEERVLKDFIETAYIFDFDFGRITRELALNDTKYYKTFRIGCNDCYLHFLDIYISDCGYKIFGLASKLCITEYKYDDKPKWKGKLLSNLYDWYKSDTNIGLSKVLEEKEYKIVEKDG